MKELVELIAKSLVDYPDEVVVKETIDGDTITIELNVAGDDMGKVIGKQGRIAKSIRTVVKAAASVPYGIGNSFIGGMNERRYVSNWRNHVDTWIKG